VGEHMAADRLHRAMATVFETCSSVLEAGRTPAADAYEPLHFETPNIHGWSPCLELHPNEHEIQSDSWHMRANSRHGVKISANGAGLRHVALCDLFGWHSSTTSSGIRSTTKYTQY
jgi:hypothetical protein